MKGLTLIYVGKRCLAVLSELLYVAMKWQTVVTLADDTSSPVADTGAAGSASKVTLKDKSNWVTSIQE